MGHREDLLAGAKICLSEKGYAHTTARDIVAASGANLASIGYHFGSKDALLTQAMIEVTSDFGDKFLEVSPPDGDAGPLERFEALVTQLVEALAQPEHRPVWVSGIDALAQAIHLPELRAQFAAAWEQARPELAAMVQRGDQPLDARAAQTVGPLLLALVSGLTMQWMIDPDNAPSGHDLAEGLRALLETAQPHESAGGGSGR